MLKIVICKKCQKPIEEGNECSASCGGKGKVVKIKEKDLHCYSCKKAFKKGLFTSPPFLNLEKKTFYCGCKGWG